MPLAASSCPVADGATLARIANNSSTGRDHRRPGGYWSGDILARGSGAFSGVLPAGPFWQLGPFAVQSCGSANPVRV